jgi:hypothetical protein
MPFVPRSQKPARSTSAQGIAAYGSEVMESSLSRTVVIVEGTSDRRAIEALAARHGRNLDAERVSIEPIGGAQQIGSFLGRFGAQSPGVRLAGLCDVGEERHFQLALERAGFGSDLTRADLEALGFFVCDADLEDELIRALGVAAVEQIIAEQGELGSFRTLQQQPAQRGRPVEKQLRRFMGTRSGRKIQYAEALVGALDLSRVPRPLERLLAYV